MRYWWLISLLIFSQAATAVNIFGMDYYLRDSFTRVIDDERGTSIVLMTDDFFEEDGSDVLNVDQYPELERIANTVKKNPKVFISITGHTDDVYPQAIRYQKSDAYARRIADYLVDSGVGPDRIKEVSGEGDLWPLAPNDSTERRHLNRRVEITFLREPPATLRFVERIPEEAEEIREEEKVVEKREVIKTRIEVDIDKKTGHKEVNTSVIVHEKED